MSLTKTPLEKRRPIFFQTGLIAALALTLAAFTWTKPEYGRQQFAGLDAGTIIPDPTPISPIPKPPAPPKPKPTNILHDVNVVDKLPEEGKPNEPKIIEFTLDGFNTNDLWDEGYEVEGTINLPPTSPTAVQRSARYQECEGDDTLIELQCTQNRLKSEVRGLAKYPEIERQLGIEGHATILFVIDEKGNVVDAQVERCSAKSFGQAALEAVQKLPPLLPAMNMGKPCAVYMKIPVTFRIQ